MIFKKLTLHNFLTFKGENTIHFPDPEKHATSLVLVLASNFSGKTNIIRGLEFLIYGHLRRNKPSSDRELINWAYAVENQPGEEMEAWVQATIITNGKETTFRRRITATAGEKNGRTKVSLEQVRHDRTGDRFYKDEEGMLSRKLAALIPESLFDYFYFQGETLADQLLSGSTHAIHDGLATLLHKEEWEHAVENVQEVRRKIDAQIQKIGEANKEYLERENVLKRIRDSLDKCRKEQMKSQEMELFARQEFAACEEQIRNLTKGTRHADQSVLIDEKRRALSLEKTRLRQTELAICELIAASKGIPFLAPAFGAATALLEQMKHQNILPADILEGFIERLLNSDSCICGRPLKPEEKHAAHRKCIEEYRNKTLAVELNAGLLQVVNLLEKGTSFNLGNRIEQTGRDLKRLCDERRTYVLYIKEQEDTIQALEHERSQSNVNEVAALQRKQNLAKDRQLDAVRNLKDVEARTKVYQHQEREVKNELDKMVRGKAHKQIQHLHEMSEVANALAVLVGKSLDVLMGSFRRSLQKSVAEYYDKNTQDGTKAFINEHLVPIVKDNNNTVVRVLGGAQRQLLVLSHIISLAELRRDLHEQLDHLGIHFGKLDDQSFILDSIFAPCDKNMAGIVAQFLPRRTRQMVVLVAAQQWHESIKIHLEPAADKVYRFNYHTDKKTTEENEQIVTYDNKKCLLWTSHKPGQHAYTTIEEVK